MEKIVRSICFFRKEFTNIDQELKMVEDTLQANQFSIQTKRICCQEYDGSLTPLFFSVGLKSPDQVQELLPTFFASENMSLTLDLTSEAISMYHVDMLFKIIREKPRKTFLFSYGCSIPPSSPYFPSATFDREGFSIGLQPTNLAYDCTSVEEWLEKMRTVWDELNVLLSSIPGFLGIDSSVAPLHRKSGSLIHFVKQLQPSFSQSVTTDLYTRISSFIVEKNPVPIGLCGIMFPCLEDFELAEEYEAGNFTIERNLFLSLHSGLGIDTYPIGVDESKGRVLEILRLVQRLSLKYGKPLSVRFVSDGKAKIGERALFNNQYLYDVVVREL